MPSLPVVKHFHVIEQADPRIVACLVVAVHDPHFVEITVADENPGANAQITNGRANALIVRGDPMFTANREQIARLALQHALPTIAEGRRMPEAGQLLSYGPVGGAAARRIASIVDRILRGTKPGDIPIEQPTEFELVINCSIPRPQRRWR